MSQHDDSASEWEALCLQGMKPHLVSHEPKINGRTSVERTEAQGAGMRVAEGDGTAAGGGGGGGVTGGGGDRVEVPSKNRADVAVHGFYKPGFTALFDTRICCLDAETYRKRDWRKVLAGAEKSKKDKHLQPCLDRRRHFTPMVYSADGIAATEARAAEKRLARHMSTKLKREYSEMVNFVRSRMSLAIVRYNSWMLRGARDTEAWVYRRRPVMEDGTAISLMGEWRS